VSGLITYFLFKILGNKFIDVKLDNQTAANVFVAVLILLSLFYGFFKNNGARASILKLLIWFGIFLSVITGYAFRFELQEVTHKVVGVIVPSYNWTNKKGEIMISRNQDGHFYIKALVNNVPVKFMIDTGASDVALTKEDAIKLNFDLKALKYSRTYYTANGESTAAPVTLSQFKIGDKIFENVKAHIGSGELDISLLGMSVIERFKTFYIDKDILILSY
jgi:aspartyl protease family protein